MTGSFLQKSLCIETHWVLFNFCDSDSSPTSAINEITENMAS